MVTQRGEVQLLDFGVLKSDDRRRGTDPGELQGNLAFMAPEQARGQEVDARADLFALGLVLYFALTGEPLYGNDTGYDLLVKAASGPGPAELAKLSSLPAPFPAVLYRALAARPEARFPDAFSFAEALSPTSPDARRQPGGVRERAVRRGAGRGAAAAGGFQRRPADQHAAPAAPAQAAPGRRIVAAACDAMVTSDPGAAEGWARERALGVGARPARRRRAPELRPLPAAREDRLGGHGRGVPGHPQGARGLRPPVRPQAHHPPARGVPGVRADVHQRGPAVGAAEPSRTWCRCTTSARSRARITWRWSS